MTISNKIIRNILGDRVSKNNEDCGVCGARNLKDCTCFEDFGEPDPYPKRSE